MKGIVLAKSVSNSVMITIIDKWLRVMINLDNQYIRFKQKGERSDFNLAIHIWGIISTLPNLRWICCLSNTFYCWKPLLGGMSLSCSQKHNQGPPLCPLTPLSLQHSVHTSCEKEQKRDQGKCVSELPLSMVTKHWIWSQSLPLGAAKCLCWAEVMFPYTCSNAFQEASLSRWSLDSLNVKSLFCIVSRQ